MEGIEILRHREKTAHKGNFGHLLVVAGSASLSGAAGLAANSALRIGTGLVTLATPFSVYPILASRFTEVMYLPLPEKEGSISADSGSLIMQFFPRADSLLIGPGLGRKESITKLVTFLLPKIEKPLVLDADGLNAIAGQPEILKKVKGPIIVTPHPGEMARLTGMHTAEIQKHRQETALEFSRKYGVVTILKGYQTVSTAPDGSIYLNFTGNPGMATAGSGDVLAGIVAGLLTQGLPPFSAARLGVYIHGLAGDLAAKETGEVSLLAGDIMNAIPTAVRFLVGT